MAIRSMLTTTDNPFDPFENWDAWYAYDTRVGHHTSSFLARVAVVAEDFSDASYDAAIESAIDEIVQENINGLYKKVQKEFPD